MQVATIKSQKWRSLGSGVSVENFIGSRTKSYKIGSKCVKKDRNLHTFKKFLHHQKQLVSDRKLSRRVGGGVWYRKNSVNFVLNHKTKGLDEFQGYLYALLLLSLH
jgi:hypothetical protein